MVLRFDNLTKKFGSVLANDSVTFQIESGYIHAIVGENGGGYSTLSKMLCGYYARRRYRRHFTRKEISSCFLCGTKLGFRSEKNDNLRPQGMVYGVWPRRSSWTRVANRLPQRSFRVLHRSTMIRVQQHEVRERQQQLR